MREDPAKQNELPAIDRNIAAMHRVRQRTDDSRRQDQKFVDRVAAFAGSTISIYVHSGFYGIWLIAHFTAPAGFPFIDNSLETISAVASLEAIFLAVFVLINQRHMNSVERRSSDLHLQTSLLIEHELTRLARLTDLIAQRLNINSRQVEGLEDVKKEVHPNQILERLSEHERKSPPLSGSFPVRVDDLDEKENSSPADEDERRSD